MRIYTLNWLFLLVFGNKNLRLDANYRDFLAENLQISVGKTKPLREKMNSLTDPS